ncbi:hypothetical protein P5V35_24015 [Mycobacteroides abscessus subsp. massiliense]|uniref:hypothetical protein n=1 Tax=Mycobacteroides abscessus TaxID=36809 RepID=UPI0009A5C6BD|nr:hypothetical protein [Mycobacteroides abscessus]MDO3208880.1 hypothetical protein [Mycobacteroides abscessus subsp. massiliense]RIS64332.1 hypothetical protein D2E70_26050 [Mycobacteroides abscessus]SKT92602.1 Uncharacterised protein [Mycobacteroides abscessus subsp. massiliense]SKU12468.1 Uncharacterised protein [Mycobacteroides abscessus subsp. massiliense]
MIGQHEALIDIPSIAPLSLETMVSMLSIVAIALICAVVIAWTVFAAARAIHKRSLRPVHLLIVAALTAGDAVILFGLWTPQRSDHPLIAGLNTTYTASEFVINSVEPVMLQAMLVVGVLTLVGASAVLVQQRLEALLSPRWPSN